MASFAPLRADRTASACPIPDEAPVISAFFPSSLGMISLTTHTLTRKREVDVDLGDDLHRFFVQQRGLIAPLPHGIERRGREQRMAAQHLQVPYRALTADDCGQPHGSSDSR